MEATTRTPEPLPWPAQGKGYSQPPANRRRRRTLFDLDALPKLLVFIADGLNRFFVRQEPLIDAHREGFRVRLGVLDRDIDLQLAEDWTTESLCEFRLVAVGTAAHVEPTVGRSGFGTPQVIRLHHERVPFPSSDRVAV